MPIDYNLYPENWKSEIRPSVIDRAGNQCECCNIGNGITIIRGEKKGIKCYQTEDGNIFREENSELIGADYLGAVSQVNKFITIVLTVAHLDHDILNNDLENLKAMCQKCHLNYDKDLHLKNRKNTLDKKRGMDSLF